MKKKLILLLLTLTLCSFNLTKVNAETVNWSAITALNGNKIYRQYTNKDGKTKKDTNMAYISIGNDLVYCVEMGVDISSNLSAGKATIKENGRLGTFFTKNTDKQVTIGDYKIDVLRAVNLIAYFGNQRYKNETADTYKKKYYLATQTLIWEYLSEAEVYGDIKKGTTVNAVYEKSDGTTEVVNLKSFRKKILNDIEAYYDAPSFTNTTQEKPAKRTADATSKTVTIVDKNEVLSNFNIETKSTGDTCKIEEENKLTCTYDDATQPIEVTLTTNKGINTTNKIWKVESKYQAILQNLGPAKLTYSAFILPVEPTPDEPDPEPEPKTIKLIKTDKNDKNTKLQGVVFELYSDKELTTKINTVTTNSKGIVVFENIDITDTNPKVYYLKEISTIEGYVLNSNPIEINLEDENSTNYNEDKTIYTISMTNEKEVINGYIKINKTDKENKKPLEGITFEIYDQNDKVVDTIKTDKDGIAKSKLLPSGVYYVKEKETLKEYVLYEGSEEVTIEENNKTYEVSFTNEKVSETGDANILLVITIAACTLICAIIIYIKKINLVKNNTI